MKRVQLWGNDEMVLWDVTDRRDLKLLSNLRVSVLRLSDLGGTVSLRGELPLAGPYLSSLNMFHTLHITWDECGDPENYERRPVVMELTDCAVLERWVHYPVNSSYPEDTELVSMYVNLSCGVRYYFDGEGEHVEVVG